MLHEKIDSEKYKASLIKKLSNFCEKAPVLLGFITSDDKVTLIHTNSGKKYDFPWNFSVPVKSFIYNIKQVLVENHYPRLIQKVVTERSLTPSEQAEMMASYDNPNDIPNKIKETSERFWRIDRVIVWKDIFILVDEDTLEQYRYKLKKSCVFFLKNYRSGKYTLYTAADFFFSNSELLNKIEPVEPK